VKYELIILKHGRASKIKDYDTLKEAKREAVKDYGDIIHWYKDKDQWFSKELDFMKYRIKKVFGKMPF